LAASFLEQQQSKGLDLFDVASMNAPPPAHPRLIAFWSTSCGVVTTASRVSLPRKITTATCIGWAAECALRAFVLMTNHVHLLLTPKRAEVVRKLILGQRKLAL
jgi:hypothetical protein